MATAATPTVYSYPAGEAGSMDAATAQHWEKEALDTLRPNLICAEFAKRSGRAGVKRIPVREGDIINMWRLPELDAQTTPLAETAADPNASNISAAAVTARCADYADYVNVSHKLPVVAVADPFGEFGAALRFGAMKTLDGLLRTEMTDNGTALYFDGETAALSAASTLSATTHKLTRAVLESIATKLKVEKVPVFPKTGAYLYGSHPYTIKDARGDTGTGGWLDVEKALRDQPAHLRGAFIGRIAGFDVLESTEIATAADGASSTTVYRNLYGGYGGLAYVSLAGNWTPPEARTGDLIRKAGYKPPTKNIRLIYKGYKEGGPSNPLERRATLGYLFTTAAKVLEAARCGTHLVTR